VSKSNDRGKIILEALLQISQMSDAVQMKRIAVSALVAIGALKVTEQESLIIERVQ